MSYTVEIIRGSTTYNLSNGAPYWSLTLTGIGLPPIRLIKERGPQQHGSTVVGHLLDERLINLALLIKVATEALSDQARDDLAEILKPVDDLPCKIRITREDGTQRQIDAYTVGTVDFPNTQQDRFAGTQMVIAQFEAPDPIPYNPALNNIVFTVVSGGAAPGGYTVPLFIPMIYAVGSSINDVENLVYVGKRETFPIIFVTGPAVSLVITNETTDQILDFTGHTIAAGVTYAIDLRYGYKTITDHLGVRQNAALTDASDLVTWSIVPTPTAPGGVNDIRVNVPSGATVDTKIRVEYYDRYPSLG